MEPRAPKGGFLGFGYARGELDVAAELNRLTLRVVARVLRRYKLSIPEGAPPIAMEAQVSLHPKGGLRLAIEPR